VALHARRRRGRAVEQSALVAGDRRPRPRAGIVALSAVALVAVGLIVSSNAVASARSSDLDQRTRTIAYLVKHCGRSATLALRAVTHRNDAQGRKLVRLARAECGADERRLRMVESSNLDFVSEDALAALDDWRRGLGLLADYTANGKPATLAKARQSLASSTDWLARVLEEIDQARLRHGYQRLP
jgi:hypothetical protein